TPVGSRPVSDSAGAGVPLAVTLKLPGTPSANTVALALVIAGAVPPTVKVKFCTASGFTPSVAVIVSGNAPTTVGVPESVPVPLRLSTKLTPAGKAPAVIICGVGLPVVVTVKDPGALNANTVALALVIAGPTPTISCAVAAPPIPVCRVTSPLVMFVFRPPVVARTSTLKLQLAFAIKLPLLKLTAALPATAVMVPGQPLFTNPFGVATTRPGGKLSVTATLFSGSNWLGFPRLNVSDVVVFGAMVVAPNAFENVGRA